MAYKSLYRAYRPISFDEVIGQQHIVQTLKNAIARDQLAHAYLFTGPRGTGKTTIAKLLAKGMNCEHPENAPCNQCEMCQSINRDNHPDIIEIDAASNNGVDDVRDLIDRVKYAPIEAKRKVYIIDEVHMLSTGAFNALLKTLEEPPEHVVFILATTEVHKVLPTIISRCQRYDFTRVSPQEIMKNLNRVISEEKLEVEDGVIETIANLADGGHRDSLTILEQIIAYSHHPITLNDIVNLYRLSTPEEKKQLLLNIENNDLVGGLANLSQLELKSIDYSRYLFDFITLCKEILVYQQTQDEKLISAMNKEVIVEISNRISSNTIYDVIDQLMTVASEARFNGQYQSYLEVALINLISKPVIAEIEINDSFKPEKVKPEITQPKPKKKKIVEVVEEKVQKQTINESPVKQEEIPIIELMVLGDKETRLSDSGLWESKQLYLNQIKYRRLNQQLGDSMIGVSNPQFILIVTSTPANANSLNDSSNIHLVKQFVSEIIGHRHVYILDAGEFKEYTEKFRELHSSKQLPKKRDIHIEFEKAPEEVEPEVIDPTKKLKEFFPNLRIED